MDQQTATAPRSRPGDIGKPWTPLIDVVEKLSVSHDPEETARIVVHAARRLSGADGACFMLREGDFCHCLDEDAIGPLGKGGRVPVSDCIAGWCMLNRTSAVIPDVDKDERIPPDAVRTTFVRSLVTVRSAMRSQ